MTTNAHTNIAARMGRWSASHRKIAIFGWLAFVIAALAIGTAVGQKTIDQQDNNVGQAHRADQILKHGGFPQSGPLTEIVVDPEQDPYGRTTRPSGRVVEDVAQDGRSVRRTSRTCARRWSAATAPRSRATGTPRWSNGT